MEYKDKYPAMSDDAEKVSGAEKEPDAYDLWDRDQASFDSLGDEFDRFVKGDPIPLLPGVKALDWWLQIDNRRMYPNLSRMAIDILSIPPMSAEAERIFSGARRTISWSRFRLGIKVVEQTECLKSWLRTGLVDNWRLANFIEKAKNLDSEGALEAV
jgi:hypothetical protein